MRNNPRDDASQRENLMQQRLRKARGEDVPDDAGFYQPYDDEDDRRPRSLGAGYEGYSRPQRGTGGGCGQIIGYLSLGIIGTLIVGALLLNQSLGSLFAGIPRVPNLATMMLTPTPRVITGAAVVQRIQQLSRLETAEYTVQTVIDVGQGNNLPFGLGNEALLLIAHGTVVAGVDLSTLPPTAVTVSPDGQTVTLQLPSAQIFKVALDNQKTRVYSRNRGIFAPENKDLESLARQQAEQQILASACEDGILIKATAQAEVALHQFLGLLDNVQVVVKSTTPQPCGSPNLLVTTPVP